MVKQGYLSHFSRFDRIKNCFRVNVLDLQQRDLCEGFGAVFRFLVIHERFRVFYKRQGLFRCQTGLECFEFCSNFGILLIICTNFRSHRKEKSMRVVEEILFNYILEIFRGERLFYFCKGFFILEADERIVGKKTCRK